MLQILTVAHTRKKKAAHKTNTNDDKRLQTTLKRMGVNVIPGIEEVNIFIEDTVVQFKSPKGNFSVLDISNLITIFR
jgi:nascent polypeptide-associated complex subunit beta